MTAVHASMLFIGFLVSFCKESFEVGGWTEVRTPDTHEYRALAEYAYMVKKGLDDQGMTFLVTQARWRVQRGIVHNIGFIVFHQNVMIEKCVTVVVVPPFNRLAWRRTVTKFRCRPVA
ncbi:hypothetical protein MTO96_034723 [Rhipicephalus appendiculatus]